MEPQAREAWRMEERSRAWLEHEIEPVEPRAQAPKPAAESRSMVEPRQAVVPNGMQPMTTDDDAGPHDGKREGQEAPTERRMRPTAGRAQGDPASANEPRGELAFSARLVPAAPEGARAPAEPSQQAAMKTPLPEPGRAASPMATPAAADAPKSLPVRELRLEVNGGERKVEVQLIERAGDVHVAVRTPDVRLAGEIRENLPALSSRLEQNGYRTETWRGPQDGSRHSGQEREPPQRQQPPEEVPKRKQKGQQFAWLMSSLR